MKKLFALAILSLFLISVSLGSAETDSLGDAPSSGDTYIRNAIKEVLGDTLPLSSLGYVPHVIGFTISDSSQSLKGTFTIEGTLDGDTWTTYTCDDNSVSFSSTDCYSGVCSKAFLCEGNMDVPAEPPEKGRVKVSFYKEDESNPAVMEMSWSQAFRASASMSDDYIRGYRQGWLDCLRNMFGKQSSKISSLMDSFRWNYLNNPKCDNEKVSCGAGEFCWLEGPYADFDSAQMRYEVENSPALTNVRLTDNFQKGCLPNELRPIYGNAEEGGQSETFCRDYSYRNVAVEICDVTQEEYSKIMEFLGSADGNGAIDLLPEEYRPEEIYISDVTMKTFDFNIKYGYTGNTIYGTLGDPRNYVESNIFDHNSDLWYDERRGRILLDKDIMSLGEFPRAATCFGQVDRMMHFMSSWANYYWDSLSDRKKEGFINACEEAEYRGYFWDYSDEENAITPYFFSTILCDFFYEPTESKLMATDGNRHYLNLYSQLMTLDGIKHKCETIEDDYCSYIWGITSKDYGYRFVRYEVPLEYEYMEVYNAEENDFDKIYYQVPDLSGLGNIQLNIAQDCEYEE